MKNIVFCFALSVLPPFFLSPASAQALPPALQEEDHQTCLARGLLQGTDAYDQCRVQVSDARLRETRSRVRNLAEWAAQESGGNFHPPSYGPGALFRAGADARGYTGDGMTGLMGPRLQPFTDGSILARLSRPEKSTVTTVCAVTGIGADEEKDCKTETVIEPGPLFRQGEISARMRACIQPARPGNFSAIVTTCGALLEDKNTDVGDRRQLAALYTSRANAYDEMGDAAHARADYDACVAADPGNALGYYNRGLFLVRQKDGEAAKADFAKAVTLDDRITAAHTFLGQMAFDQGDYETALVQFSASIRLDPDTISHYMRRGATLLKMGQTDKAMADLKVAAKLDPRLGKTLLVDGKPLN